MKRPAGRANSGYRNPIDLLVIQPTSFCNLDCSYCYVPERTNKRLVELKHLRCLFDLIRRYSKQDTLHILWHAGEPLAAGLNFYKEASALLNSYFQGGPSIRQSMQSNGVLVNDEWCKYFADHRVAVGLSLDGPKDIHDEYRRKRSGTGSFEQTMAAARMMRRYSIATGALCVLTPKSIREPALMFDFFRSTGIGDIAFNVEETEGENKRSSLFSAYPRAHLLEAYASFMEEFFALNYRMGSPLRVREMQSMLQRIRCFRETGFPPRDPERILGAILTMTRDGLLSSWAPELASVLSTRLSAVAIGHVCDLESIDDVLHCPKALAVQDEIDRGVEMCRQTCQYFSICGGGSPSNKFFENGTFASTETLHCATQMKALAEVVLVRRFIE
jgi:uncharacterized protein